MEKEKVNKISKIQEEIRRLESEYEIYHEHGEEASEPIRNNIDKRKRQIEEWLIPIKEELNQKEEEMNNKIEQITNEAQDRLKRL